MSLFERKARLDLRASSKLVNFLLMEAMAYYLSFSMALFIFSLDSLSKALMYLKKIYTFYRYFSLMSVALPFNHQFKSIQHLIFLLCGLLLWFRLLYSLFIFFSKLFPVSFIFLLPCYKYAVGVYPTRTALITGSLKICTYVSALQTSK